MLDLSSESYMKFTVTGRGKKVNNNIKLKTLTGLYIPQPPAISSTNKTDHHDITEILLKVALRHHNPYPGQIRSFLYQLYWGTNNLNINVILSLKI